LLADDEAGGGEAWAPLYVVPRDVEAVALAVVISSIGHARTPLGYSSEDTPSPRLGVHILRSWGRAEGGVEVGRIDADVLAATAREGAEASGGHPLPDRLLGPPRDARRLGYGQIARRRRLLRPLPGELLAD